MTKPLVWSYRKHLRTWWHMIVRGRSTHTGQGSGWHFDHKCSMEFCGWPDPKTRRRMLDEAGFRRRYKFLRINWVPPDRTDAG